MPTVKKKIVSKKASAKTVARAAVDRSPVAKKTAARKSVSMQALPIEAIARKTSLFGGQRLEGVRRPFQAKGPPPLKVPLRAKKLPASTTHDYAMRTVKEVVKVPAASIKPRDPAGSPIGSYASMSASIVDLYRHGQSVRSRTAPKEAQEVGLFLVRPRSASASQALSSFPVELHESSRTEQLKRLREFRADTQKQLDDVKRWSQGVTKTRQSFSSSGLISAGVVMRLTAEEAVSLRQEVRDVQVIQNRLLSLVTPTVRTLPAAGAGAPLTAGWHLEVIGQRTARANGTAFSGKNVRVAVLDTGIELEHIELAGRVTDSWMIDPANSTVGASAVVKDLNHQDTDGHGTHVAGLICGQTVGVAPDARLTSLLMMPKGYATTFDFIRCLDWVAEHPEISLVNFSAGEDPFNDDMVPIVADLIRMGVLPFFAVGNEGENKSRSPGNYVDGMSVGSVDPAVGHRVSSFSGSGRQTYNQTSYDVPDLVAPGSQMWSSYKGGRFATLSGTSMATPVACGVAACLLEQAGGLLSPADLSDMLRRSCVALSGEPLGRQGRGLIRVPSKEASVVL